MSTAYHPQTNGQIKDLNRCLEGYLRCMFGENPSKWSLWLALVEWWYNNTYHSSLRLTPYEALYGQEPPHHLPYILGTSSVTAADKSLKKK